MADNIHRMIVVQKLLLFLHLTTCIFNSNASEGFCKNLTTHKYVNTDYVIAGIFPVHYYSSSRGRYVFNAPGLTWVEAILFAINEINANNVLLPGIKLGYALYDSCNSAAFGLESALDVIQEPSVIAAPGNTHNSQTGVKYAAECYCNKTKSPVVAVVGDAASTSSERIASILGSRSVNMAQISYSSTSTALSNKENFPSFLRTIPPDNFQALFIIDILKRFNWKYVSFVASDDSYGRLGVENLLPLLANEDICVAVSEVFDTTNKGQKQVESIVNKLVKDKRSMVVVLWCQYPQAEFFLKEAEKQLYYDRVWIATETWGSNSLVKKINPRVVGGLLGIIPAAVKYAPFEDHLKNLTPNNSVYNPWIDEYWRGTFNCKVTKDAKYTCPSKQVPTGNALPRNKYINVIDAVYAIVYGLREFLFNSDGSKKVVQYNVLMNELLQSVQKVNFTGKANLYVNFNRNGDPGVASYSLTNLQLNKNGGMDFKIIGQWDSSSRKLTFQSNLTVVFSNWSTTPPKSICSEKCSPGSYALVFTSKSCCWTCVKCLAGQVQPLSGQKVCNVCTSDRVSNRDRTRCIAPEKSYLSLKYFWGTFVFICTIVGILLVLFVAIVVGYYWDTPLVKALNRQLSIIQIGSIFMIFAMPVLHFFEPSISVCYLRPFYFIIFYTISVSVTFTKTDRLLRVFKASGGGRLSKNSRILNNRLQIITVIVLTIIAAIICTAFFFVFKPKLIKSIDFSSNRILMTYSCGNDYKVLFVVLLSYIFGIALTCTSFAFRARKLPENYNEARFTSFAMFSFCLSWLCFVPLFFSLKTELEREVAILLISFISTTAMFAIQYGPRIYVIVFHPEENTVEKFRAKLKTVRRSHRSHSGNSPSQNVQRSQSASQNASRSHNGDSPTVSVHRARSSPSTTRHVEFNGKNSSQKNTPTPPHEGRKKTEARNFAYEVSVEHKAHSYDDFHT